MKFWIFLLFFISAWNISAQDFIIEIGGGIGNVIDKEHRQGKGQIHLSGIYKLSEKSDMGIDLATGGDLFFGDDPVNDMDQEIISPYGTRFESIMLLFRYFPLGKRVFFLESRAGYSSLNLFVHTDDTRKIAEPNLSLAFGPGAIFNDEITCSLRYQYYGKTARFQGFRDTTEVISNSAHIHIIMLHLAWRINLTDLFRRPTP